MKDEKYGLLSYLKNYLLRILITLFVSIYLIFVFLLIYFWLGILSLHSFLKKKNRKKSKAIVAESRINLTEDMKAQGIAANSGSIQLIPLSMYQSGSSAEDAPKEPGKFFILHV